jgi:hypothetical protein
VDSAEATGVMTKCSPVKSFLDLNTFDPTPIAFVMPALVK